MTNTHPPTRDTAPKSPCAVPRPLLPPLFAALIAVGLGSGCRTQSIEYVGKAGKSLAAYSAAVGDSATLCELRSDPDGCKLELVGRTKDANVYETDRLVTQSLAMLAEYGAALEKLSGKKSVGADAFVEGMLTLNGTLEWVELGDTGPDAIKASAASINKLIAGGVQRKEFDNAYKRLEPHLPAIEARYRDTLTGQLATICLLDRRLRSHKDSLEDDAVACPPGSVAACETTRALTLMNTEHLREDLRRRRAAIYSAGEGIAMFFAVHERLGQLLTNNAKSDTQVVAEMKAAGSKAKSEMTDYLAKYEGSVCGGVDP